MPSLLYTTDSSSAPLDIDVFRETLTNIGSALFTVIMNTIHSAIPWY